jgi:PAS domain S-box-containing protein
MEQKPIRILLVEDEEPHAEAVRRAFETRGDRFRIKVVSTLQEASEFLRESVPDLVIADWILGDGRGTDLLPPDQDDLRFPVVVLTSRGSEQVAVEAMRAGALDYVVKSPRNFAEMPRIAERALREWNHIVEHMEADQRLMQQTRELSDRIKKLNCLFALSEVVEDQDASLHNIIQRIVALLPDAWQHPEVTCARATVEGDEFATDGFRKSPSCQEATIKVHDIPTGSLEVYYREERPEEDEGPFRKEERSLLNAVAERLGRIIECKRAERALRESEERFRAIFEGADEMIFLKDADLRYTHVNPALCNLLGVPAAEILGRRANDFYDEKASRHLEERDLRVLTGERIEMEHARRVRGTLMTFHDTIVPIRDSGDEIVGICGISRDITERTRLLSEGPIPAESSLSQAMQGTLDKARIAANTESILLLQGESGSGKDYLARWIHERSQRSSGPFFAVNCAAIARELAESELFGHERGAFTGAAGRKKGMFELAEGGTILLNEIGELELSLQSKLLAFLDTHSFLRVGGEREIQVDTRLIAATHRNLEDGVAQGRFLEPLYYRLSVFPIHVPPLRERSEDMPVLVETIMAKLAREMQLTQLPRLGPHHMDALTRYPWPGNIRELSNVLERSLILWKGGPFELALPASQTRDDDWSYTVRYTPGRTVRDVTDEIKSFMCAAAMDVCQGNKKEAAKLLNISRDAFYKYIKRMAKRPEKKTHR